MTRRALCPSLRRGYRAAWLAAISAVQLISAFARADDADATSLLRRGVDLRREHRNEEALEVFRRSFAIAPTPMAQAQIGLAEQALGRWLDAERDLDAALSAQGDERIERNRATFQAAREVILDHLAWLSVEANAPSADATLDGRSLVVGSEARVLAGTGVLEVHAPGYASDLRRINVAARSHVSMAITLSTLPPVASSTGPTPVPPPAPPMGATSGSGSPWGPVVGPLALGALGAGALGIGAYYGVRTFDLRNQRNVDCPAGPPCSVAAVTADHDARTAATTADVAFGVAAASIVAGGIWFWLAHRSATGHPSPALIPVVGVRFAGVSFATSL